ncbi:MAG: hypothetical protein K2Q22_07450, partial [Cytophagales bacterium]|nr:hypothetical protein [Cytophagales bacterium]
MKKYILLYYLVFLLTIHSFSQVALTSTGANNVFNIQYPANITSLSSGLMVTFFSNQTITNTGTSIVLNGLGPNNLYKNVNVPLTSGDIKAGQSVTMIFDGTNWQLLSTSANVPTSNTWTLSGTNLLPTNQTANLGIGTISPQNKMDVNGGVAIGSYAGISAGPLNGLIISNNLGVGLPNPAQLLDVNGVARIRNLSIGGAVFSNSSGDLFVNSALGVTGAGAIGGVAFWTSSNTLSADGTNFFYDRVNARLGIRNNAPAAPLDVSGGSSWSGNLANFIGNNPAGVNGIFVNTNLSGGGSGILISANGGAGNRYGVNSNSAGSTGPTYGIFSMGASNGNTSYGVYAMATGTGPNFGVYGSATGASGVGVYGTGAYAGIFMGGNVGVKTSTPAYPLDVNGDVNVSAFSNVYRVTGLEALRMNGNSTIMVGGAGNSTNTAANSSMVGYGAGASLTSGSYNVMEGFNSGRNLTTGGSNVLIGYSAGYPLVSANGNTMVGYFAGYNYSVVSGDYNTYLGPYADANVAGLTRAIAIGYAATVG